jgi:adenylate kinase
MWLLLVPAIRESHVHAAGRRRTSDVLRRRGVHRHNGLEHHTSTSAAAASQSAAATEPSAAGAVVRDNLLGVHV